MDDVPLNCWIRHKVVSPSLVTGISETGIFSDGGWKTWGELSRDGYEQSTDLKTWAKCQVEEDAK